MTSRERWTVYPLLFLTLGITLKDKVTKEITTERVNCRAMVVTDREGKPQISLASTPTGGLMNFADREGKLQIALASTPSGGLMRIPSAGGTMWMLGNTGALSGLMFVDSNGTIQPTRVPPLLIRPDLRRERQKDESERDASPRQPDEPAAEGEPQGN